MYLYDKLIDFILTKFIKLSNYILNFNLNFNKFL